MKYAKILSVIALASLLFSCNKVEYPAFEYGPKDDAAKKVVFFPTTYASEELDPVAETYEIAVERVETEGALTVPVTVFDPSEVFGVPANVVFADGEATSTLIIDITKMELETPYELTISLPADNFHFYDSEDEASAKNTFHLKALKQKWIPAGTCTFWDGTFIDAGEDLVSVENIAIQQHEGTNDYRILAPYAELYGLDPANITFSVKDNKVVFKEGTLDFWSGSGYYVYWNTSNYSSYCYVEYSKENDGVLVEVNSLVTDGSDLYTGGYFAFLWTDGPLKVE